MSMSTLETVKHPPNAMKMANKTALRFEGMAMVPIVRISTRTVAERARGRSPGSLSLLFVLYIPAGTP